MAEKVTSAKKCRRDTVILHFMLAITSAFAKCRRELERLVCHPFVGYHKEQNVFNNTIYCVLSNYLHHNTNVILIFNYRMLKSLKILLLQVSHVHYFSDEAPFQYQNFKNLTCNSPSRWPSVECWVTAFFCYKLWDEPLWCIGGTVKRLVTQSSFQNNHILNVDLIYGLWQYSRNNFHEN